MPETISDPKLTVRDLLRDAWDNGAVHTTLDESDIHTGWFDDGKGFPQVAVSNRNENVAGGGRTGFTAIAGDGAGGVQSRTGTVLVTAFAGSRADYEARGLAQQQAEQMADEVSRIVGTNQSPDQYLSLSVGPREDLVDTDANPTEFGVQYQVRYAWTKEPPRR